MKAGNLSNRDIPILNLGQQLEEEEKMPQAIFEDQEAHQIPESMKLWNEIA